MSASMTAAPTGPSVALVPQVRSLLARWQATPALPDITNQLENDTRTLLTNLLTLPDQSTTITNLQDEVAVLLAERINTATTIRDLQAERDAANEAINELQTQLEAHRTTIRVLSQAPAQQYTKVISWPKEFDGTRSKLQRYIKQVRRHTASYTDEQSKLRLAFRFLVGDALAQVHMYVRDDRVELDDLAALITILENAFGNPNRVAEAEAKLFAISQGSRDFRSYYAEFQRYASKVAWCESAKLATLRIGLSYQLKENLIHIWPLPTTIAEYATVCRNLDAKLRQLNAEFPQQENLQPRPAPVAQATTAAPTAAATTSTTATGTAPGAVDLSTTPRRISRKEITRRMAERRCYRCGEIGHMVRNCPLPVGQAIF